MKVDAFPSMRFWLFAVIAFGVCGGKLVAQTEDPISGIPVRIWASGYVGWDTDSGERWCEEVTTSVDTQVPSVYNGWLYQHICTINSGGTPLKVWRYVFNEPPNGGAFMRLFGSFMPWTLPANGSQPPISSDGVIDRSTWTDGTTISVELGIVRIVPGRAYTIHTSDANLENGKLNITPPPGYLVVMNNVVRNSCDFGEIVFRVLPSIEGRSELAGNGSTFSHAKIDWSLPLGSLRNGQPAGAIRLVDGGMLGSWTHLFSPGALSFTSTAEEIFVYQQSGALRQIIANQVAVDILPLSPTGFELKCYNPAQVSGMSPSTFTGLPFVTYKVEPGTPDSQHASDPTAKVLSITKIVREITDPAETNPSAASVAVVRTETQTLQRVGTFPDYNWTRRDWFTGSTPVTETFTDGSATSNGRSESIAIRNYGGSTALTVARTYTKLAVGEEITAEQRGTSQPQPISLSYHESAGYPGSYGYVKTVSLPGGGWEWLEYHDTNLVTGNQVGQIYSRTRPYSNTNTTPNNNQSDVERTTYEYEVDSFGTRKWPKEITEWRNGSQVGKTVISYYFDSLYSIPMVVETRSVYRKDSEPPEISYRRTFDQSYEKSLVQGMPLMEIASDGSHTYYLYERGALASDGVTFTSAGAYFFDPGGHPEWYGWYNPPTTGSSSRISIIKGKYASGYATNSAAGMVSPELVPHESTKAVTIRDARALPVRLESYIWRDNEWKLIGWTNMTYNHAGLLTSRISSNGAIYTATYSGLQLTSDTDENGITKTYTYDAAGRLDTVTKAASSQINALETKFSYDATGKVKEEKVGSNTPAPIISTKAYDQAGRLESSSEPGKGTTTVAYDVTGRTTTTTLPNGGTLIEAKLLNGRLASRTGTATTSEFYEYGYDVFTRTLWTKKSVGSSSSIRWEKSYTDWLGRTIKTERPSFNSSINWIEEIGYGQTHGQSSFGKPVRVTRPGPTSGQSLVTRTEYTTLGRVFRSGLDINDNGLVVDSEDRVREDLVQLETFENHLWRTTTTYAYPIVNSSTAVVEKKVRERLTGFQPNQLAETRTEDADSNLTTAVKTVDYPSRRVTVTTTTNGVSQSRFEKTENGLLVETTGHDGLTTRTVYDSLSRPWKTQNSRQSNGQPLTVETTYVSGTGLVANIKEKAHTSSPTTVITYEYDTAGRKITETNADGKATRFAYSKRDQLTKQWGPATYPVAYAYNGFGEKIAMRTFRSPTQDFTTSTWPLSDDGSDASNPDPASWTVGDKTTWAYDAATGLLTSKTDASNRTVSYTYNLAGQLATRAWARKTSTAQNAPAVTTTYTYSATTGEQTSISYNDSTPSVHYTYTRLGQSDSIEQRDPASSAVLRAHDFVYDPSYPHRLYTEALDGFFGNRVITRLYDSGTGAVIGRPRGFKLGASVGSNSELEQAYAYSATTGRFDSLTTGHSSNATTRTFRYGYETNSNLLKTLWTDDNSFFVTRSFEDNRDVLTAVDSKWGQSATNSITRYGYVTNDLGQRQSMEQSGDAFSGYYSTGAIHQTFSYNDRSEVKVAPTKLGTVASPGAAIANRQHEFDYDAIGNRKYAGVTGSPGDRRNYTANALNQYSSRDNSAAPFTGTQSYTYDDDGNVLTDGQWAYTWDAENRLVRMTSALPAGQGHTRLELNFKYDYLGRRVEKKVENIDGPTPNFVHRYLYDGWSLVAEYEYSAATLTLKRSYTWGLDIARTLADAGGVGALLQISDHGSGVRYHPTYDGNGNVMALVNGSTGTVAAAYEYSPYGEFLRCEGTYAKENPFRFSTKFTDDETGLVYYGRRYYSPSQGRFLGRDPIAEQGGLNLYGFVGNSPINRWDFLGMNYTVQQRYGEGGWLEEYDILYVGDGYDAPTLVEGAFFTSSTEAWAAVQAMNAGTWGQGDTVVDPSQQALINDWSAALRGHDGATVLENGMAILDPGPGATAGTVQVSDGGFDPVLASAVLNGSTDFRTANNNRGARTRTPTAAEIELSLMNQIGAERDPVRRSILETQLVRFQQAHQLRPPTSPRDAAFAPAPTLITNRKHHPQSISPQPANFVELFSSSIPDSNGVRWAVDGRGVIHRFSAPSNGQVHWNGSTATRVDPIQERNIPNEILIAFGPFR